MWIVVTLTFFVFVPGDDDDADDDMLSFFFFYFFNLNSLCWLCDGMMTPERYLLRITVLGDSVRGGEATQAAADITRTIKHINSSRHHLSTAEGYHRKRYTQWRRPRHHHHIHLLYDDTHIISFHDAYYSIYFLVLSTLHCQSSRSLKLD